MPPLLAVPALAASTWAAGAGTGAAIGSGAGAAAAGLPAWWRMRRSRAAMASSRNTLRPLCIIIGVPGATDMPPVPPLALLPPPPAGAKPPGAGAGAGAVAGASRAMSPLLFRALSWLTDWDLPVLAGAFLVDFLAGASQELEVPHPDWAEALVASPPESSSRKKKLFIAKKNRLRIGNNPLHTRNVRQGATRIAVTL